MKVVPIFTPDQTIRYRLQILPENDADQAFLEMVNFIGQDPVIDYGSLEFALPSGTSGRTMTIWKERHDPNS